MYTYVRIPTYVKLLTYLDILSLHITLRISYT